MKFNHFWTFFFALLFLSMAVGFQKVSAETLINNGSFETGDLTGFTQRGSVTTIDCWYIATADNNVYSGTHAYFMSDLFEPIVWMGSTGGQVIVDSNLTTPGFYKKCVYLTGDDGNLLVGIAASGTTPFSYPSSGLTEINKLGHAGDQFCLYLKKGTVVIPSGDCAGSRSGALIDYLTLTTGSEYKPVITSLAYKPSPATYNFDINVYSITQGYAQKLQCGDSPTNTSNICSVSDSANDPSCVFKNHLQNGDTNIYCQAVNINGVYSDVNRILITSSGYGTPIINFVTPITNTTLISQVAPNTLQYQVILEPVTENQDMVFQVYNTSSGSVDVNFQINNSLTDGNRYFVYTASEFDYSRGIWNLSDELNFGTGGIKGLQKIWDSNTGLYHYFIIDSGTGRGLISGQKKYYKLVYAEPFKHWNSLNSELQEDWDIALNPSYDVTDGHTLDTYSSSAYSNVRNVYRTKFPSITTNVSNGNLILAVTADTNSGGATLKIGNYSGSADSTTDYTINNNPYTFTVTTSNYPLIKNLNSTFAFIDMADYALMERGFFVSPLRIANSDNSDLPAQLYGSVSRQTLIEGKDFRIQTSLYNHDGRLSKLEAFAYVGSITAANQIAYWQKDFNSLSANEVFNLDWTVPGIIDINGTAPRDIIIEVRATDSSNNWFYIQSDALKMQQYPYNPNQLSVTASLTNTILAQSPKLIFNIHTIAPEILRGVDFRIYDENHTFVTSDYNKTFYKGIDFSCNGFDCSMNKDITQYIFPRTGHWYMTIIALLTTQNADKNNSLTSVTNSFIVDYKSWNIAKIYDVVERNDRTYRNDEKIPLALVLRTSDYANLKADIIPQLKVWNCSAADSTDCIVQDINYVSSGFYYNKNSGLNIWYFTNVFYLRNGNLLPDGNYIRFSAVLNDVKGQFQSATQPLLTTRCQTGQNAAGFISNAIVSNILYPLLGCNAGLQTPDIVTLDTNQVMESRIHIDVTKDTNSPNMIGFYCFNTDVNNVYKNTLKQTINCEVPYQFNEANIDKFDIYLTNAYSDLSKDPKNGQYIKVTVPYELIAANDITILNQQIKAKYGGYQPVNLLEMIQGGITNFLDSTLCTVWHFLGWNCEYPTQDQGSVFAADQADTNYNLPASVIEGMFNVQISGIKVINQYNYISKYPDLNTVNTKDFLEYAAYKGYSIPIEKTHYKINIATDPSSNNAIYEGDVDSPIVVNANPEFMDVTLISNDANVPNQTLPYTLDFKIIMDMYWNTINVQRMSKDITLGGFVDDLVKNPGGTGFGKIINDTGRSLNDLLDNPNKWFSKNWFGVFMLGIVIFFISIVYGKFKKNGGVINNIISTRRR